MSHASTPSTRAGRYLFDRNSSALTHPVLEDVKETIGELLPEFTDDALRGSYLGETLSVVLGVLRAREPFPRSSRLDTQALVSWENRTKVTLAASDAFDVLCDPSFASLMPYAVSSVHAFGEPLRAVILEIQRRLPLDPYGLSLLWIGSGGHVSPLHHDGDMVHGRWHLVVRGAKQFDFLPPGSRRVPRLPRWDLHRRFSTLYKAPIPDAWLSDGTGAHRLHLAPGQMVAWGRRWWHRVEIARSGVTIGLSTRGQRREEMFSARGLAHLLGSWVIGEVEHYLEGVDEPLPRTLAELRALCE
jgi:hypothetical protein